MKEETHGLQTEAKFCSPTTLGSLTTPTHVETQLGQQHLNTCHNSNSESSEPQAPQLATSLSLATDFES